MATYTDQQVFKAFMAGANRGLVEKPPKRPFKEYQPEPSLLKK